MSLYIPASRRFQSLAASQEGQDLWALLNEHDNIIRLMTAADLGHPAVEGVDDPLWKSRLCLALSGPTKEAHALRQLAGLMTRDVLTNLGYRIGPSIRTRHARIFSRGATYFKGADMQQHACGQLLKLHHHPLGNGQVVIYYTPPGEPDHKVVVLGDCPKCGKRVDRRSLTDAAIVSSDE